MKKQWLAFVGLIHLTMAQSAVAVPDLSAQEFLQWSKRHLLLQPIQVVEKLDETDPDFVSELPTRLGDIEYQIFLGTDDLVERERVQYRPACFELDQPGCQGEVHFERNPESNGARVIKLLWGEEIFNDFVNSRLMLSDTASGEKHWYQGALFNYETWHFDQNINAHFSVVSKGAPQTERIQRYQACLQQNCRGF